MKKADIAERQEQDREEWQKHGVGGMVKAVDAGAETIKISTGTLAAKDVAIHVSKNTIIRRYAPHSVKFDDAKPGSFDQIKSGDQLRARGTRSADGNELTADEIVSGTFRNIAGTVVATDQGNNSVTVMDLASRRPVTLKITADSHCHALEGPSAWRAGRSRSGRGTTEDGERRDAIEWKWPGSARRRPARLPTNAGSHACGHARGLAERRCIDDCGYRGECRFSLDGNHSAEWR
jgi:hypothetical protein